jgi:hypothetical protein
MYLAALSDHRIEDHVASGKISVIAASGIGFLQYRMALSIPFFVELCLPFIDVFIECFLNVIIGQAVALRYIKVIEKYFASTDLGIAPNDNAVEAAGHKLMVLAADKGCRDLVTDAIRLFQFLDVGSFAREFAIELLLDRVLDSLLLEAKGIYRDHLSGRRNTC